ncbi:MAG: phage head-tail connector protein [Phycisphaerales bacterium]|nr:MAG: phage head-tail connector protein [Phycisphaerales bacterium]
MAVEIVTPPTEEPVTLVEAKAHLRVDVTAEDDLITRLIAEAREWVERYTRRAVVDQTWRLWVDRFPDGAVDEYGKPILGNRPLGDVAIWLPGGKIKSINSVKYIDSAGVLQTLAGTEYALDSKDPQKHSRLLPAYGKTWPIARSEPNAVQIEYTAGYGDATAVPAIIKQAVLLHVGWNYENREAVGRGDFLPSLELKLADVRLFQFA